ncbi:MAG: sulfatase-like hydrolase/transferase [Planctomycetes bacterium]|nr:sulfatase-like hydrolase/transferase [Planctomycetota bacterium]
MAARSAAVATLAPTGLLSAGRAAAADKAAAQRPNFLVLLADDLGWGDISLHGGKTPTPHIDAFFRESVELTTFMTCPVCSPTRAGLLTGRHNLRLGAGPKTGGELDPRETTIAEAFKAHGYATGIFGKWHNGDDPDTPEFRAAWREAFKSLPNKKFHAGYGVNVHGFDEAWVYYGGGADYFTRRTVHGRGPVSWWHNRQYRPADRGYTDDLIVRHAVEFLRANKDRPFFCYVPFHLVHAPLQAKPEELARAASGAVDADHRTYSAMLMGTDNRVGAILREIDALNLRDNTVVLFFSDNGATKIGSNLPLRLGKHSAYEGGVHSPAAIRWPAGHLPAGRKYDGMMGHLDVMPTFLSMAGLPPVKGRPLDGRDVWPALRSGGPSPVESYYWVWGDYDVVRTEKWKLFRYVNHVELYDIRRDLCETTNVADEHPDVVKEMTARLEAWRRSTGVALMHQAPRPTSPSRPAPQGDVLEVRATVTTAGRPRDSVLLHLAARSLRILPGDYLEYDICIAADSLPGGFYLAPFRTNKPAVFNGRRGVDQFGRLQAYGPPTRGAPGTWERRVIGLGNEAPSSLNRYGVVLMGRRSGTLHFYLDNIQVRRGDGSVVPIWTGVKDTRYQKPKPRQRFTNISVRAVGLDKVR